jgi:NAD(P)H-dependent FMN reductase
MNDSLNIVVLAGTTRAQRQSIKAAHYVAEFGQKLPDVAITFVDPEDFNFPGDGNDPEGKDPRYSEITAKADAFFIVTPEYNHSFPGSLKRMLDSELGNYVHKPVAIAGASKGYFGGVRGVESLVLTVREMGMAVTFTSAYFPFVQDAFDDNNQPVPDQKERLDKSIQSAYDELIWMAKTLKYGRDTFSRQ